MKNRHWFRVLLPPLMSMVMWRVRGRMTMHLPTPCCCLMVVVLSLKEVGKASNCNVCCCIL